METFLIRALQLMMSLSLLVIIHEGGHYLFARLFKIRVEKFYLFFDAWFALFRYKPKNSHTEYGIGWLPLGGYVKIAGMIDESMDKEQMAKPPQPWEFRSKPAWQRLLVMIGGVLFNFLLALFIYSMILFTWGDSYYSLPEMDRGMKFNERAQSIGFRDGDILLRADDKPFERYGMDMLRDIVDAKVVTVRRDGREEQVYIPDDLSLLTVGKLTLNTEERVAIRDGEPVELTAKEYDLIELLMRNPRRVYSRENLMNVVWGYEYIGDYRTVDVHINRLRDRLKDNKDIQIVTVRGLGYKAVKTADKPQGAS